MSRNIQGKPGNKGKTKGEQTRVPGRLPEDVKADYEQARADVAMWRRRAARGATMKNRLGDRVRSPEQISLENAQAHLRQMTKLYLVAVAEPVVEQEDGDLVVLDFDKGKGRTG